jgi:hypothetical protein
MKPFDFAQDRLREIQAAPAKTPGLHPGYQRDKSPLNSFKFIASDY